VPVRLIGLGALVLLQATHVLLLNAWIAVVEMRLIFGTM
jgi:hypothetical protein